MFRSASVIRVLTLVLAAALTGCVTATPDAPALSEPGKYPRPTQPVRRLSVGVAEVAISSPQYSAPDLDLKNVVSDQLFEMLQASNRYDLTDRHRLQELLVAQHQTDAIQPGKLTHPIVIQGVDYVFLAEVA